MLVAALLAACRPTTPRAAVPVRGGAPPGTRCAVAAAPTPARDTVTIGLTEPVDPAHAPVPRNDAERLVFPQLYETLLQVDCDGRIVPGLARSWSADEAGRRWTFTLRGDARLWDGSPVTAQDVVASWIGRHSGSSGLTWSGGLGHAATVIGERAVRVEARAADRFFWWWSLTGCHLPASGHAAPERSSPAARRIVYDRADPIARDLAARLVARSLLGPSSVAAGLAPDAFAAALDAGDDAYVLALRRRALDRCREAEQIPPLVRGSPAAVIPPVDTSPAAIARRGSGRLCLSFARTRRLPPR